VEQWEEEKGMETFKKRAEQVLPGSEGSRGRGWGQEAGGRNGPTIYVHMNK
jgi:hypothetical protein